MYTSAAMSWGAAAASPAALFLAADAARDADGFFSFLAPAFFLVLLPPPTSAPEAFVAFTPPLRGFLVRVTEGSDNKAVNESEIEAFKSGKKHEIKIRNK